MPLKIRSAECSDIPALEAVINQHWAVNIDHDKELQNPNAVLLVAEREEKGNSKLGAPTVVGTALMWVREWNKTGYLVELAVSKQHQRRGYASKIIEELARRAKDKGLRAIIVETQLDNKGAMDFYLKKGFRLCGYNDRYYTNTPTSSHSIAIFFSLDL